MALFKAADLLNDPETEHDLKTFDSFQDELSGETYSLTITVLSSIKIVEEIMALSDKCMHAKAFFHQKGERQGATEIEGNIDHKKFVTKALNRVYVSSVGDVLDEHSKEAIVALARKIPDFLQDLSSTLLDFYKTGNKFLKQEEEEAEKN
jgi:hypothetical protein